MASSRSSVHSHDSATVATLIPLHKRLFFPSTPVPPLFLSPSLSQYCDDPFYQLLALVARGHILPWYSRLTRDRTFLYQVARIITHVVQIIEQRVSILDIPALLASNIPLILTRHYRDARTAKEAEGTTYSGAGLTYPQLFHSLQPHPGMAIDPPSGSKLGIVEPPYLSNLVDGILSICLPLDDAAAETERAVVREVIVYVVLAGVFGKVAQPWFIHQQIVKALKPSKVEEKPARSMGRTVVSALFAFLSGVVTVGTLLVQWIGSSGWREAPREVDLVRPGVDLVKTILRVDDRPTIFQSLWLVELVAGLSEGYIDGAIRSQLDSKVLTAERLAGVLISAKDALFPDGNPAPTVPDLSEAEAAALKVEAEALIGALLPDAVLTFFLPDLAPEKRRSTFATDILGAFDSHDVNAHLLLVLLELATGVVFPELLA